MRVMALSDTPQLAGKQARGGPAAHTARLAAYPHPLLSQCRRQHRRRSSLACVALDAQTVFGVATVAVMPFYALMIAAPQRVITARLVSSELFLLLASAVYAALLLVWAPLPLLWHTCKGAALVGGLPDVAAFAALFTRGDITALAWIHLLVLDLFQARLVYLDGLRHRVPTAHSLVLCFMVGPLGLLSHLLTKAGVQRWRQGRQAPSSEVAL